MNSMKRKLPFERVWANGQGATELRHKPTANRLPVVRLVGDVATLLQEALDLLLSSEDKSITSSDGVRWSASVFRTMFHSITPTRVQRDLLLRMLSTKKEAVSVLIGAPPYYFLSSGESHLINATGISKGRVNMTYDAVDSIQNYSQFGDPLATDASGAHYTTCTRGLRDYDLHAIAYFDGLTSGTFEVYVRLPKTGKAKGRGLTFPKCRDVVTLTPKPAFVSYFPEGMLQEISLRVLAIRTSSHSSSTAVARVEAA